jgi:hypothetical protein
MKYYIIAGEASGDLHGSNLMKGIYAEDPDADIRFWGGDLMHTVWKDFTDRATPLAAGGRERSANSPVGFCSEQVPGVGGVVSANRFPDGIVKDRKRDY